MPDHSPELPRFVAASAPARNQPSSAPAYQPGPYANPLLPADIKSLFDQFWKILRKQGWKLVLFLVVAMLLTLLLQILSPRLYSATALLRLDRHSAPGAVGQEASQVSTINDMDVIIDTDMEVAQSDPVVRPVAEQYHLIENETGSTSSSRWFALSWFASSSLAKKNSGEPISKKPAPIELTGLKVTRPANTYLIRITYRAWRDPQLAANVANGIATSLVQHVHESLDRSYDDLSEAMRRDMGQLRTKMDDSSKRLTEYENELKMVDPEQRSTVLTSRLTQLLAEYTAAQADRLHKQAATESIRKSPTLAATEATEADHQRQSLLDESLARLSAAQQQFVAVRSYYGENHPEYRKARQQLDEAQAQVERMQVATGAKAQAEYKQALGRELLLKQQFDGTKAEVDGLKAHALAYSQLKAEAENDRRMYMDLEVHTRDVDVNRQFRDATVQFVAPALPPANAIFPKLKINLPIAFVLALLLGILGAIAADALDTSFSDADEVASRMRLDVMATLPDIRPSASREIALPGTTRLHSRRTSACYQEAIRMLRNALGRAGTNQFPRTLLITSSVAGEGRSTTAAHLAEVCAQQRKKVLLIDADLRRPSLHQQFSIARKIGLADVLAHHISPMDVIVETGVPGLFLMPAGSGAKAADLIALGFGGLLNKVRSNFELVVIDAPPLLGHSETQELATMVDGVVVLAKAESTAAKELAEALTILGRTRANVLGIVMNQVRPSHLKGLSYCYQQPRFGEQWPDDQLNRA